jgi:tRNA (pseudouridine54-N1)-methyltransferase
MAQYVVRARAAPVDPERFRGLIGQGAGVEYLAEILRHALFISQAHREEVTLHLVLEKGSDYSRVLTISGDCLGSVPDLHETSLLSVIVDALIAGRGLGREAEATDHRGIRVRTISFESLVKSLTATHQVLVLTPDGPDIRHTPLEGDPVFVMTDHTPMPKNTYKSMARQGVKPVSVGPKMLHTAQCITLINNELDRRQAGE